MARLIHLSDLHFGAHDQQLVDAVEERVDEEKPDLVVISGDFTQRARTEQFEEACDFLERLRDAGHDVLGVPGNHDVPLYDVLRRFLSPLTRYRRYIDDTLVPVSRAARRGGARHQHRALADLQGRPHQPRADGVHPRDVRAHRPRSAARAGDPPSLVRTAGRRDRRASSEAVGRQRTGAGRHRPRPASTCCSPAINHRASTHSARDLVTRAGPALVVQAGTATSTRLRDEEQSFNRIEIDGDAVTLTVQRWAGEQVRSPATRRDIEPRRRPLAHRRRREGASTSRAH